MAVITDFIVIHMKRKIISLLTITILFSILSCSAPSENEIKIDFLREFPKAQVLSMNAGEGDSDNVYMHIKYKLPESDKIEEDVWLYQDTGNNKWENTWRRSKEIEDINELTK